MPYHPFSPLYYPLPTHHLLLLYFPPQIHQSLQRQFQPIIQLQLPQPPHRLLFRRLSHQPPLVLYHPLSPLYYPLPTHHLLLLCFPLRTHQSPQRQFQPIIRLQLPRPPYRLSFHQGSRQFSLVAYRPFYPHQHPLLPQLHQSRLISLLHIQQSLPRHVLQTFLP